MKLPRTMLYTLLIASGPIFAYEIGTHAYVSKRAVDGSVLSPTHVKSIVPVLGFERLDPIKPFEIALVPGGTLRQRYFDNLPLPAMATHFHRPVDHGLRSPPC